MRRVADGLPGTAASILGYGILVALLAVGVQSGRFPIPGGDTVNFLDAGMRLRLGGPVYTGDWNQAGTVYYAPPLVVLFAAFTYLPPWALWVIFAALDFAGLRYLAGSWRRVGWAGLVPVTAFQLASGNPNFAIVAACLAASSAPAVAAVAALAKVGPAAAIPLSGWRPALAVVAVAALVTLPWLALWPAWVAYLIAAPHDPGWPVVVPVLLRLPLVAALVLIRKPWSRALAGALAIPGFYIVTLWATIILAARLLLDARFRREPHLHRRSASRLPALTEPGA